jgi:hypothetical protein
VTALAKRWWGIGVVVVVVTILAAHFVLDGVDGLLWSLVYRPTTKYAAGYSSASFRRIQRGMTRPEVLGLLGEPLEKITSSVDQREIGDTQPATRTRTTA